MRNLMTLGAVAAALLTTGMTPVAAATIKPYWEAKNKPAFIPTPNDISTDTNGTPAALLSSTGPVFASFEGITQYDNASFARNFIPPDTNGAVGKTQYVVATNGAYAVYDKATGTRLAIQSDLNFWASAGQAGANGDSRVMYNAASSRWILISFGNSVSDIQIAVSDTDNALGPWKSTKFTGYAGLVPGLPGTADYPTLAMDTNAVYIGTNNFARTTPTGANSFRGTTLNVIPLDSLFNGGAPTTANIKQFNTPYNGTTQVTDRGFAIQGVNSTTSGSTGTIAAASLFFYDSMTYTVNGLTSTSATGATLGGINYIGEAAFTSPVPARQPSVAIPANRQIIDSLDERISSSVYEANGRIYMVHTVDPSNDVGDYSRVRYVVIDKETNAILDEGDIGTGAFDYYQGSIAVNALGDVVIGYNRSGLDPADGKITFLASMFRTYADGTIHQIGTELKLKESLTDDYHNGSLYGQPAAGRQRWGDYSQVSLDPTDTSRFWVIGQFAREYNLPQFGHPGGTGGSRWGTWVAGIDVAAVPEPATWAMMISGFGLIGGALRRQRKLATA